MKHTIIILLLIAVFFNSNAQQIFITKGKIEYEKQINIYNQFKADVEEDDSFWEMFKSQVPKSKTFYFDLYFTDTKSIYKPGREVSSTQQVNTWLVGPCNENIVYKSFAGNERISKKNVYDNTFLVQDSLRQCAWKMTNDTRTIAGFECKKATTIIMDSIYIVAFYTDQIIPSNGPESFGGLPGMILGLAIPRLHTTWFATKLENLGAKDEQQITPPNKGKKVTPGDLKEQVNKSMKNWGKQGNRNIWQIGI